MRSDREDPVAVANDGNQPGFRPVLGVGAGVSMIIAVVIGAGIFSVPQQVAEDLGGTRQILLLWLAVGVVCLVTAMVFAEIAARFPRAGADYLALREAYGGRVAFLFGWRGLALAHPSNRAALALVFAHYVTVPFPALQGAEVMVGTALLIVLGFLNAMGVRRATVVHVGLAGVKVVLLVFFVVLAFARVEPSMDAGGSEAMTAADVSWWSGPTVDAPAAQRWARASLLVFFAYTGFPRIVQATEEFRNPGRGIPWSMGIAMVAVILLYLGINYAYLRLLGVEGVRSTSTVGASAMEVLFGSGGATMVAFAVVVSVMGSISVSIMASSRLYFAMASGGHFFRGLARLHPASRVPTRAIALHVVLAIVFLVVRGNFVDLVMSATFLNLAFYALRVQSLFVLRRRDLGEGGGFRMPWYPWLPLGALASMYAVLVTRLVMDWERAWFDVLVLAVGLVIAGFWTGSSSPGNRGGLATASPETTDRNLR